MFARRPAADENATASVLAPKGTHGLHASSKSLLGRPAGKLSISGSGQRTALGDLTNTQKPSSALGSKRSIPTKAAASGPEEPVEKLAGKSFLVLQDELVLNEEARLQETMGRVTAGARYWTTSYLDGHWAEDTSSDDGSDSDAPEDERFPEIPIVMQMPVLAPKQSQDAFVLRSCGDTTALLPEVPEGTLDLDFCWSDDDTI